MPPHDTIYALPQLGGRNCARPNRFFPSLQLGPPMVPTRTLRDIIARTRPLTAAQAEIEHLHSNVCDRSIGCACVRCAAARALIARPLPPNATPPRLRTIPEAPPVLNAFGTNVERDQPRSRHSLTSCETPVLTDIRCAISLSSPAPSPRIALVGGDDHVSIARRTIANGEDYVSTARLSIADCDDHVSMSSGNVAHISATPAGAASTVFCGAKASVISLSHPLFRLSI